MYGSKKGSPIAAIILNQAYPQVGIHDISILLPSKRKRNRKAAIEKAGFSLFPY